MGLDTDYCRELENCFLCMVNMTETAFNAVIQELALQRNAIGDRALNLAAQLAEAQAKIADLEKKIADSLKPDNVVEMPDR